ncbi:hypothetical protein ACIBF1_35430 [Spirillospora sp. NPDC050679]
MPDVLVVPIRLDALCLERDTPVTGPLADFSRLPYVDPRTGRDVGADTPYVSEQVLPPPFQDQDLLLEAGIHLHWTLPDALTRMEQVDGSLQIPSAPDRWMVVRSQDGIIKQQWIVESDYLSGDPDGTVFPVDAPVPFRGVGRVALYGNWREAPAERLPRLTAIGYGEPAFAAFYPNCRGVFGMRDTDIRGVPPAGVVYEVLGWYADPARDVLVGATAATLDGLGWSAAATGEVPTRSAYYARLTFAPASVSASASDEISGVYIGTTATEALAAHLGGVIPGTTPDDLENLIEALAFADELEARALDVGAGLDAARHAAGFRALPAGTLWTLRRDDGPATEEQRQARDRLVLPAAIGDLLNGLNSAQDACDRAREELTGHRERIFADWYKYQLCVYRSSDQDSYPEPDDVRGLILAELGALGQAAAAADGELSDELRDARRALDAALAAYNTATAAPVAAEFVLAPTAAPQFHQPTEPVVLLTGGAATPSGRYGADTADGPLACAVMPGDLPEAVSGDGGAGGGAADPDGLRAALSDGELGATTWTADPWHPVLLQWEAEFYPAGDNLAPDDRHYGPSVVLDGYRLDPGAVDLAPLPETQIPDQSANVYSGTTVLSAGAAPVISTRVLGYLAGTIVAPYAAATGEPMTPAGFLAAPDPVLDWYAAHGDDARLTTLVAAYRHLAEHERDNLAQVLGGFNDALLMRRLTRQLPVADPLGFPYYQSFAARVAAAVGDDTTLAPDLLSDFNPLRAGALRISRLRIVDNFGRPFDVDVGQAATTTRLRVPGHPTWAALAPRAAQPARASLRWLDSDHDLREMNDVPATSPICGWLVPDDLSAGLVLYTAAGAPLGILSGSTDTAAWRAVPGRTAGAVDDIGNPHLRAVAQKLQAEGPDAIADLVADLQESLDRIEPADYGGSPLSVRPLAVVRAELDLRLQGPPAVDQDWNVLRQDMARGDGEREDDSFPGVLFPLRIGDTGRLDDGVAGYWTEAADGALGDFAPITAAPELTASLGGPPIRLTLLVDPRAPVHLVSGILPVKAVSIPPEQYRQAMGALRVPYFTAPVLADAAGASALALPLPDEPGQTWSWTVRDPAAGWVATAVAAERADQSLPDAATLREGWLTPAPTDTAAPPTDPTGTP